VPIRLGSNSYGKSEVRVVRVVRDTPRHRILDRNVSTALQGDFAAAYIDGDQAQVLPTDTQKNTVYAYAKDLQAAPAEDFAVALARHFVDDVEPVRVRACPVEEYAWERIEVDGEPHQHSFVRLGQEVRTTTVTAGSDRTDVVSGLTDLVVLKSTGSEFTGFLVDELTTLQPTDDRVLATSLTVRWRYAGRDSADLADVTDARWTRRYANIKAICWQRFRHGHSRRSSRLWESGPRGAGGARRRRGGPAGRTETPHFVVDLDPFGARTPARSSHADDRPYGLITAVVERDEVPPAPRRGRSGRHRPDLDDGRGQEAPVEFLQPRGLDEALSVRAEHPDALAVNGGTTCSST
jgi:urate oxidase